MFKKILRMSLIAVVLVMVLYFSAGGCTFQSTEKTSAKQADSKKQAAPIFEGDQKVVDHSLDYSDLIFSSRGEIGSMIFDLPPGLPQNNRYLKMDCLM